MYLVLLALKQCLTPDDLLALFEQPFTAGEQKLPINACFGFCTKEHASSSGVKST